MKYVAAYLLAVAGGKAAPTAADVKAILESVAVSVDDQKLNALLAKFEGKNIEETIEAGAKKMIAVGGAAPAAAAATGAAAEEAKEEKKEEEEAAAPLDLGDMFGDF